MDPDKCSECGCYSYSISWEDNRNLCPLHLATDRSFPSERYNDKERKEYRERMEQSIVEQIQARIRND